jgi:TetR/AcrR family transcriptional repressor of nem operon
MSPDTRNTILQEAEFLIRTRGYAAFSYADLAERMEVTKASIHYYFPTKEDLIVVLHREYMVRFVAALASVKAQHAGPGARLRTYANFFLDGFEKGMLPLCGALSAERSALPASMQPQVTLEGGSFVGWALQAKAPVLAAFETALKSIEITDPALSKRSNTSMAD